MVEASFTDLKDMARALYPQVPLHWIGPQRFRSVDKVAQLDLPKLFIHGTADTTVPLEWAVGSTPPPPSRRSCTWSPGPGTTTCTSKAARPTSTASAVHEDLSRMTIEAPDAQGGGVPFRPGG